MRPTTLVYLVKKQNSQITDICLAMKKRGFGQGWWNGYGGKPNPNEKIIDAAKRETNEESEVEVSNLNKVAVLDFIFPDNPTWDQTVHVFLSDLWTGEIKETEEMKPKWFKANELPLDKMWDADKFWTPLVLSRKLIKARFDCDSGGLVLSQKIQIIKSL